MDINKFIAYVSNCARQKQKKKYVNVLSSTFITHKLPKSNISTVYDIMKINIPLI